MRPVCVLGLGLIGGSVLKAATRAGWEAFGASHEPVTDPRVEPTVTAALARAARSDALVVVAVPLPAVDDVLREVAAHAPDCLLTDVVSVKQPVADAVAKRLPNARYAGGHPMAGKSASGWDAAEESLFDGAAWVVTTDEDVPRDAWRAAAELALACGAEVVPTTTREHDAAVARISHLPHILAAVLASTGADGGSLALSLAAGSFRDGTRVMTTRPELVLAMCEGNRGPLLAAVDEALGRLGAARGALASTGGLAATVRAGHDGRQQLEDLRGADREEFPIDLTDPEAFETLRDLGTAGGRLLRLEGDTAIGALPA
ncbi:prephenate dehydrogenase [Actinophytocola sp. NPDC049390]|uniref:prephenate dehydrogenase n=1 Tax=Actinophytocola sp. NPDC049390 TaxID=3363894 RepID=UPI003788AF07